MITSAGASHSNRAREDGESPVVDAFRRAKPVPPEDRERLLTALAEVKVDVHDPSRWMTTEQLQALLAAHPGAPRT